MSNLFTCICRYLRIQKKKRLMNEGVHILVNMGSFIYLFQTGFTNTSLDHLKSQPVLDEVDITAIFLELKKQT